MKAFCRALVALSLAVTLLAAAPSAQVNITVSTNSSGLDAEIGANAGYSDVSPHQIVRTSGNVEYLATPACISYPTCYQNSLSMQKANAAGVPASFSEQDAAHHPTSPNSTDAIGSSALAIDGNGIIWVAYNTRNYGTHVVPFDTTTNTWGTDRRIGTDGAGGTNGGHVTQGKEGVAIAVNSSGTPSVVFSYTPSTIKYIAISTYSSGAWSAPIRIDDAALGTGQGALHPTIAYTSGNDLLVAWLVGNEDTTGSTSYNNPDGTIYVRELTNPSTGTGAASYEIPDTGNENGNPGYAMTTIDQGPSLMVTADGVAHITYVDTNDQIRYWYSSGTNYADFIGNEQPTTGGAPQETHDPSLGPDGSGGLFIYGHGTPSGSIAGHGNNLYRFHKASGSTSWGTFAEIVADTNVDCSVSTRWSQFFDYFPSAVDFEYWNDHYPNAMLVSNG